MVTPQSTALPGQMTKPLIGTYKTSANTAATHCAVLALSAVGSALCAHAAGAPALLTNNIHMIAAMPHFLRKPITLSSFRSTDTAGPSRSQRNQECDSARQFL